MPKRLQGEVEGVVMQKLSPTGIGEIHVMLRIHLKG